MANLLNTIEQRAQRKRQREAVSSEEYGYFNREHQFPCETCGGAGWTEARLPMSMREIAHMAEKFPDGELPIERQRCAACQGSGGGEFKSGEATAHIVSREKATRRRRERP